MSWQHLHIRACTDVSDWEELWSRCCPPLLALAGLHGEKQVNVLGCCSSSHLATLLC